MMMEDWPGTPETHGSRASDLLSLQNTVLEAVAWRRPLLEVLDLLCRRVDILAGDTRCSVLLLDGDCLRHGAAPGLPAAYTAAIDGVRIGPCVGSCGTAAFRGEPVEVRDIAHDPLWAAYAGLALAHGLMACWSTPIVASDGRILGTFALYFGEPRGPGRFHQDAVRASTHLAAIAIERARLDEAERQRIEELARVNEEVARLNRELESRVARRTADLDARNRELQQALTDLQLAQDELLEVRKLASLGRMVAGIAHELNTPLGNARVLATTLDELAAALAAALDAPVRRGAFAELVSQVAEVAALMSRAVEQASARVAAFRAVATEQTPSTRATFRLADCVQAVVHASARALREHRCTCCVEVPESILLDSYPGPLQDVLAHLIGNALHHAFAGQADREVRVQAALTSDGAAPGVEIVVIDNGCGIAGEVLDKVFDPFFTTQIAAGRSGLGLSAARNAVRGVLGGTIQVESVAGRGTTIAMRIPLCAPQCGNPA